MVRLLRDAIRQADLAGGKVGPLGTHVAQQPNPQARRRVEPEPRIEPRKRIEPTPRFEPRRVIHPRPRVELEPPGCPTPPRPCGCQKPSPLRPPWRMPVWKVVPAPAPQVKVHIHRTDVIHKGSLIDLFI